MQQFTVIKGGKSLAERRPASVAGDGPIFGPPPTLAEGIAHAILGAACGLLSLWMLFFIRGIVPQTTDPWAMFIAIGALVGWFLRAERRSGNGIIAPQPPSAGQRVRDANDWNG